MKKLTAIMAKNQTEGNKPELGANPENLAHQKASDMNPAAINGA